jgi:DNA-binding transcriptional MerR regulator/methylmalonyl-CoA mutase cobalamin-binding subunit
MYTIKQAAARAGVSVPLLRAWERRYGVVHPERTASGYRLYDEGAISRLAAMRRLLDGGWSASNAAASVREMGDEEVRSLAQPPDADSAAAAGERAGDGLIGRFAEAAGKLDLAEIEQALDQAFSRGSFEHVASVYLLPMMVAVGDAWPSGQIDIAGEHAASHAMLRRLAAAFEASGRSLADDRPVLVGLPPGARHELGALTFAVALRRAGLAVTYLGQDLPADDWVEAARMTRARAAVIGVVTAADLRPARRVAAALRDAQPDLVIAVGGRAAGSATTGGLLHLPDDLVAAVDLLRGALT